ncbi:MAG: hypothetical protein IH604_12905 [Burkholderiales bacterium]|nr:hypothetical protein [Burkholderiales bacterium]
MGKFFSGIFRWLLRQAATLLLILAVLIAGVWLQDGLKNVVDLQGDRATLVARMEALSQQIQAQTRDAAARTKKAAFAVQHMGSILEQARAERQQLRDAHPLARNIPLSEAWIEITLLDQAIASYQEIVDRQTRSIATWKNELNAQVAQNQGGIGQLRKQIAEVDDKLKQDYFARLITVIGQKLPIALGVLLGVLLVPIGIKVFFYFVIAPWAAARPPIRLLPAASGSIRSPSATIAAGGRGKMSAVSLPVVLAANQELLIQPEYLQSTALQAEKKTRWLLNARIPFSSLLSGMYMLTRVGPAGTAPVVISATKDPLSEVGIIELAEGAAFVCQPRSLAAVIQESDRPIRITRHWRLGSLQAWLTLQLRFLVFHGPGQLVMKGCRGIRIESAGGGRLINQAATLGFSANLDYANTRCETFVSYWSGKEDLFNDLFTGAAGVYVYEEMPDLKRKGGITGRGLEGFSDGLLKVFGV